MKVAAVFVGLPVAGMLALTLGFVVIISPSEPASGAPSCAPLLAPGVMGQPWIVRGETRLDQQQRSIAATVVAVGKELEVPPRGLVVALAAGLQESGLRPLRYGDRDSLGVFQQRTPWGSAAQRINPRSSAAMFFTGGRGGQPGLLDIRGWIDMSITEAAQAVQRSAYPTAYAKWEWLAVRLVEVLTGDDASCEPPNGWVFPLGNASYVATAGFGDCGSHWDHCHTGQDFAAPTGTPVVAAGQGVVMFAGRNGSYGNAVRILHPGGTATWYAHLSRIEATPGASVRPGQVIGLVGSTGNSTGSHLHFEVRIHADRFVLGSPIDPLRWLQGHGIN